MKKLEKIKDSQKLSFNDLGLVSAGEMIRTGAGSITNGCTVMSFGSDDTETRWPRRDKTTYNDTVWSYC